jgi:hypothetical protein
MFLVDTDNSGYAVSATETRPWHDSADGSGGGGERSMDVPAHGDGCGGSGGADDEGGRAGSAGSDPLDINLLARDPDDHEDSGGRRGDHHENGQHAPDSGGSSGSGRHDGSTAGGPYWSWKARKNSLKNQRRSADKHA